MRNFDTSRRAKCTLVKALLLPFRLLPTGLPSPVRCLFRISQSVQQRQSYLYGNSPEGGGRRNFCFQRIKSARRRGERSLPTIARKYLEHKSRQKNWSLLLPLLVRTLHLRNTEKWGGEDTLGAAFSKGRFLQETVPPSIFPLLFREKFAKRHR